MSKTKESEKVDPAAVVAESAQVIKEAEFEARSAEDLVEALEKRVMDGDADVTAEEVENARGVSRIARLRRDGALKRKAEAQARIDEQTIAEFLADLRNYKAGATRPDYEKFYDAVAAAAEELGRVGQKRSAETLAMVKRAKALPIKDHPHSVPQEGLAWLRGKSLRLDGEEIWETLYARQYEGRVEVSEEQLKSAAARGVANGRKQAEG